MKLTAQVIGIPSALPTCVLDRLTLGFLGSCPRGCLKRNGPRTALLLNRLFGQRRPNPSMQPVPPF